MTAETGQETSAPAQSVNGRGPAPEPCEDCGTPLTDRLMGVFLIATAVFGVFIGVDLASGGALSRAVFDRAGDDA
jgi:hypothetical protein